MAAVILAALAAMQPTHSATIDVNGVEGGSNIPQLSPIAAGQSSQGPNSSLASAIR